MTQTSKQVVISIAIVGLVSAFFLALPSDSHARGRDNDGMLRGLKATASTTRDTASSTKPVRDVKNLSCVQEAVKGRETAVMTAWTSFNTDMVSALTKRTDALVAAWKVTDAKERGTALKSLWTTWKTDSKKAHSEMRADRKAAWTDFKKTMKEECKETKLPKEDVEPKDASGEATI